MNNIHLTKVNDVRREVSEFVRNICEDKNKSVTRDRSYYENKYPTLLTTSKTLFNFIIKECARVDFNELSFDSKLNNMLELIEKIQRSEISQNTASERVGEFLAKEYIPQLK